MSTHVVYFFSWIARSKYAESEKDVINLIKDVILPADTHQPA